MLEFLDVSVWNMSTKKHSPCVGSPTALLERAKLEKGDSDPSVGLDVGMAVGVAAQGKHKGDIGLDARFGSVVEGHGVSRNMFATLFAAGAAAMSAPQSHKSWLKRLRSNISSKAVPDLTDQLLRS